MAESPNPHIDLSRNSVRARCPVADCSTAVSVHESMRSQITTYKCREHDQFLVIEERS